MPRPAELVALSERLLRRLEHYFELSRTLAGSQFGFRATYPWDVEDAMVESFAMHTRALADFFFTQRAPRGSGRERDAFAFYFWSDPSAWHRLIGDVPPWLRQVRLKGSREMRQQNVDRFGEQLAHVTFYDAPVTRGVGGWPVTQLAAELGGAAALFAREVNATCVCTGFSLGVLRQVPLPAKVELGRKPQAAWTRPHGVDGAHV